MCQRLWAKVYSIHSHKETNHQVTKMIRQEVRGENKKW